MSYEYAADEDGNYSTVWQDDVYTDPDSGDITTTYEDNSTSTETSNGDPATRFGPDYTYDEATGYYTNVADPSFVMDRDGTIIGTSAGEDTTGGTGARVGSSGGEPDAKATGPTSTAAQVTALQKSLPAQAWDAIKGAFTKDGIVDWKALAAAGGGIAGLATSLKNQSNPTSLTGYQGKIPQLTAVQQQVAGTNDPTRRPGSSGQRYFSDLLYAPASSVPSAQTATQAQAPTFAAQNAANPAVQPAVPTTAAPASSVIDRLAPTKKGLGSLVNPATQTPSPKPAPQYDPNMGGPVSDGAGGIAYRSDFGQNPQTGNLGNDVLEPPEVTAKFAALKAAGMGFDPSIPQPTAPTRIRQGDGIQDYSNYGWSQNLQDFFNQQQPADSGSWSYDIANKTFGMGGGRPGAGNQQSWYSDIPQDVMNQYVDSQKAQNDAYQNFYNNNPTPLYNENGSANFGDWKPPEVTDISKYFHQTGGRGREQPSVAPPPPPEQPPQPPQTIDYKASGGGITALKGGNYLAGSTDGMADKLPANIDGNQEARLSHGEFVIPADVVSHLGNGNSESGANRLYSMMDKIRKARTGTTKQGKRINPDKFLPGGAVGYAEGGIATFAVGGVTGTGTGTTTVNPAIIGQESNLSNWAGDYVTNMLGKGKALSDTPYQSYSGPLTAGATAGQTAAFDASAGLKAPTSQMGAFTPQTFTSDQAQKYMNPFVSSALNPQMEEMRRQSQLNLQPNMAKLTQAGGYGGSRQALMSSEANRNLLQEQNKTIGQGYQTAFDKAMAQFNTEQGRGLEAQSANNAYGLQALSKQAELGGMQRGITQEGITADKAQFEEEKQDPYKKVGFQQSLLSGLPVAAQSNTYQQPSLLNSMAAGATTIAQLYDTLFPAKKN